MPPATVSFTSISNDKVSLMRKQGNFHTCFLISVGLRDFIEFSNPPVNGRKLHIAVCSANNLYKTPWCLRTPPLLQSNAIALPGAPWVSSTFKAEKCSETKISLLKSGRSPD